MHIRCPQARMGGLEAVFQRGVRCTLVKIESHIKYYTLILYVSFLEGSPNVLPSLIDIALMVAALRRFAPKPKFVDSRGQLSIANKNSKENRLFPKFLIRRSPISFATNRIRSKPFPENRSFFHLSCALLVHQPHPHCFH